MEEKKFSGIRIKNVLLILCITILLSVALGVTYGFFIDQIIADGLISILFFLVLILCLIHSRMSADISENRAATYTQFRNIYFVFAVFVYAFSFLPEYSSPILLLAIFMTVASNGYLGIAVSGYFSIVLCLMLHANFYELCAYIFLAITGCVISELLKEKKNRTFLMIFLFCAALLVPNLFHFLSDFTFNLNLFLYSGAGGFLTDLLIVLFFDKIDTYTKENKSRSLDIILDEDYPLAKEIKAFSKAEYKHATKVAELCEKCAPSIGADAKVAKAAGFYYHLGKIDGEKPFAANSVALAQADCFPPEVVSILAEYNGELRLPSTIESALVHIIDTLVTKFEILDKNTVSSTWNYEVVIYQAMNEKSSTGLYDESGLTMNQFLKIRDFFVKGEKLF